MTPPRIRVLSRLRPLLALCAGLAVPFGCDRAVLACVEVEPAMGEGALWVADRDGGCLASLDDELYVRMRVPLIAPVAVAACADGGAWALDAVDGRPTGALALVRVGADGVARAHCDLARTLGVADAARYRADLDASADGGAWVCLAADDRRENAVVAKLDAACAVQRRWELSRASALAVDGDRLFVGAADGACRVFDGSHGGALVGRGDLGAPVLDACPAGGGAWWTLTDEVRPRGEDPGRPRTLWLLGGADLAPIWRDAVEVEAEAIAPTLSREDRSVWLVSHTSARVQRHAAYDPEPRTVRGLPLGGFGRAAATGDSGLFLPAPGAVLELDPDGRLVRTQGGFDFVVEVSAVPRRPPDGDPWTRGPAGG